MPEFVTHSDTSSIDCAVCGAQFRVITASHLRRHALTVAQYTEQYPDAPLACEEVGLLISDFHRGVPKSKAHREKLTRHLRPGHEWSEDSRKKVSQSLKGRKFSEQHRALIGAATQRQWAAGARKVCYTPKWESDAAVWLVEAGVEFHHQYHIPGFSHPYDFYLPKLNLLVELDGCFWHGCECQGGPLNEFAVKNMSRDREAEHVANNFGYKLIRFKECEFSQENFMGSLHHA